MFIFTADNHLGIESQWSIKGRKFDFLAGFGQAVQAASSRRCPIVIGGDLFDTTHPPSFAVEYVQRVIRTAGYDSPAFGIDGNHDRADGKWLGVCGIKSLADGPVAVGGHRVLGIPFMRSSSVVETLNLAADSGTKCDVVVLHLAFGELNRMGAASDVCAAEMLPALKEMGVRLVLMGHIHVEQQTTIDGITFAYCGSTEVCSFNEPHRKTVTLVRDDLTLDVVPIPTRNIVCTVIGNEKEFAAYESGLAEGSEDLQAVFVANAVKDGVKRLHQLAVEKDAMMRVQVVAKEDEQKGPDIDRTVGVIGLEQAIGLFFEDGSEEADLTRAILRSPTTLKQTVENFMKA